MKRNNFMKSRITQSLTLVVSILILLSGYRVSLAHDAGTSRAIFYVA